MGENFRAQMNPKKSMPPHPQSDGAHDQTQPCLEPELDLT
jgi:hypothetical protein